MGGTINQRTTGGPFCCISVEYHGSTVILTSIRTSSRHVFFGISHQGVVLDVSSEVGTKPLILLAKSCPIDPWIGLREDLQETVSTPESLKCPTNSGPLKLGELRML